MILFIATCIVDPPRLAASPKGGRWAEEGETVFFVCSADANPPPDVKFIINGRDVDREYSARYHGLAILSTQGVTIAT